MLVSRWGWLRGGWLPDLDCLMSARQLIGLAQRMLVSLLGWLWEYSSADWTGILNACQLIWLS
jgi:hypothetical protein